MRWTILASFALSPSFMIRVIIQIREESCATESRESEPLSHPESRPGVRGSPRQSSITTDPRLFAEKLILFEPIALQYT